MRFCFLIILLIFNTTFVYADEATSQFSLQQKRAIETIVRDYLIKNPDVLVEAAQSLQTQQQAKAQDQLRKGVMTYASRLFQSPQSPSIGNPRAQVNVVEFFDYQCGYCRYLVPILKRIANSDLQVRIVFKEYPVFNGSEFAAKAALASQRQGKYLTFHEALFTDKPPLTQDDVLTIAKRVGLNVDQLKKDMNDPVIAQQIQENRELAKALGIMGAPTFIVATNPILNPQAPVRSFLVGGAVNEKVLREVINQAKQN